MAYRLRRLCLEIIRNLAIANRLLVSGAHKVTTVNFHGGFRFNDTRGHMCLFMCYQWSPSATVVSAELFSHGTGTLRCLQKEMATYRHWSVSLWWDPDGVPHCQILFPDKTEWWLISATLCGWRCCFMADQFMTCIREEEEVIFNLHCMNLYWICYPAALFTVQYAVCIACIQIL